MCFFFHFLFFSHFFKKKVVAILDAGSQYGKLIDRNIRGLHVLTELLPLNTPAEKLLNYK